MPKGIFMKDFKSYSNEHPEKKPAEENQSTYNNTVELDRKSTRLNSSHMA